MYIYICTLHNICAVPNTAVFCSPLISCCPGMLLRYCLNDFEMVPVAPITTCITFAFTFHMCWISTIRSLYFNIFSASFLITFLSQEIAASINMHAPFLLSRIMMSSLLLGIVTSVCTCWFCNMATLPSWLVSTDLGTWSYQCSLFNLSSSSSSSSSRCCCCCYCCFLLSQAFSSWYFSWTNGDPHHSCFKFKTVVLSILCVMFLVLLSFILNVLNVFLVWIPNFSLNLVLLFQWPKLFNQSIVPSFRSRT